MRLRPIGDPRCRALSTIIQQSRALRKLRLRSALVALTATAASVFASALHQQIRIDEDEQQREASADCDVRFVSARDLYIDEQDREQQPMAGKWIMRLHKTAGAEAGGLLFLVAPIFIFRHGHLSDPIRALASIARVARSELVITTQIIEKEDRTALFLGDANHPDVDYCWWLYTIGIYRHVLKMLGFEIIRMTKGRYKFELANRLDERTTIVARRVPTEV